jgi:hypothetical protein
MLRIQPRKDDRLLRMEISVELVPEDYERLTPYLNGLAEDAASLRALVVLRDYRGGVEHVLTHEGRCSAGRVAVVSDRVGDGHCRRLADVVFGPRTEVRRFDAEDLEDAERWLLEPELAEPATPAAGSWLHSPAA